MFKFHMFWVILHFVSNSAIITLLFHTVLAKTEVLIVSCNELFNPCWLTPVAWLSATVQDLFLPRDNLRIFNVQDYDDILETVDNCSATNSPCIITISVGFSVTKLYAMNTYFWPIIIFLISWLMSTGPLPYHSLLLQRVLLQYKFVIRKPKHIFLTGKATEVDVGF
jgi:hypothetical protein